MDKTSVACRQLERGDASLTLLNLSCQGLGSKGVDKLARSCRCDRGDRKARRTAIVALWLESNDIYSRGAPALVDIIDASPRLRYLYLAHNSVNDAGASDLAKAGFRTLEICNLTDNQIGPAGSRGIATSLLGDAKIRTLILDDNKLRDEGVAFFAEALRENTSLRTLSVKFNHVGKDGLRALRDALARDNMTLEHLLLEEEDECSQGVATHGLGKRRNNGCIKETIKSMRKSCSCETCSLRNEVEYYLALNRAGRHSFCNMQVLLGLWPRILSRVSADDPSLVYDMISLRPDLGRPI